MIFFYVLTARRIWWESTEFGIVYSGEIEGLIDRNCNDNY